MLYDLINWFKDWEHTRPLRYFLLDAAKWIATVTAVTVGSRYTGYWLEWLIDVHFRHAQFIEGSAIIFWIVVPVVLAILIALIDIIVVYIKGSYAEYYKSYRIVKK